MKAIAIEGSPPETGCGIRMLIVETDQGKIAPMGARLTMPGAEMSSEEFYSRWADTHTTKISPVNDVKRGDVALYCGADVRDFLFPAGVPPNWQEIETGHMVAVMPVEEASRRLHGFGVELRDLTDVFVRTGALNRASVTASAGLGCFMGTKERELELAMHVRTFFVTARLEGMAKERYCAVSRLDVAGFSAALQAYEKEIAP